MAATAARTGNASAEPAQVEMVLAQIEALPTLPPIASRLLELTGDESSSARQLVDALASDQSLSARILKAARRADVGSSASTIRQAVLDLGFQAIRSLVLSVQVFETFSQRREASGGHFDRAGFWKHSLAVACAARLLAEKAAVPKPAAGQYEPVQPEEAFICGLLHDVGKVVFDACFPKSYERVISATDASRGSITEIESKVFGIDHTIAGHRLASHWKLPAMIRECIWLHHHTPGSTPTRIAHSSAVCLVQVADRLVREMRIGYSGNYAVDQPAAELAGALGIGEEDLGRVMSALPALIEERAELIGLTRLTTSQVYQEALLQANAELSRITTELAEANRRLEQRSRCLDALCLLQSGQGDEPTHEDALRATVEAAALLAGTHGVAALGVSRSRSLSLLASRTLDGATRLEILSTSALDGARSVAIAGGGWQPASLLAPALVDRLQAALGAAPAWCWPLRHLDRFYGVIAVTGDPRLEPPESFALLSEASAAWLNAAEVGSGGRQLNEELAEMNRRLVSSQGQVARMRSLAMVGEMAAGAAHELNNPLAVISGRAQLLSRDDVSEDVRRSAAAIAEHAHRASAIVSELMDYAKPAPPQPTAIQLSTLLNQLRREWIERGTLAEDQFEVAVSDEAPVIHADASQMRMLFDEIIRNAVDALRGTESPHLVVNCLSDLADENVVIRIQDNGCGMSADIVERAMDPFFSHRPAGRGRGLGLSRAARYAQVNGGRIRLTSVPGEGTSVFVEMPVAS